MSFSFSIQKSPIYGTYGDFSVGAADKQIRANYVLTKIKPGDQGRWENQLATQMAPWREIFKVDELSFDELKKGVQGYRHIIHSQLRLGMGCRLGIFLTLNQ